MAITHEESSPLALLTTLAQAKGGKEAVERVALSEFQFFDGVRPMT